MTMMSWSIPDRRAAGRKAVPEKAAPPKAARVLPGTPVLPERLPGARILPGTQVLPERPELPGQRILRKKAEVRRSGRHSTTVTVRRN